MAQCLCPNCGELLSIPDTDQALRLRCSKCAQVFETVPQAAPPPPPKAISPLAGAKGGVSPLVAAAEDIPPVGEGDTGWDFSGDVPVEPEASPPPPSPVQPKASPAPASPRPVAAAPSPAPAPAAPPKPAAVDSAPPAEPPKRKPPTGPPAGSPPRVAAAAAAALASAKPAPAKPAAKPAVADPALAAIAAKRKPLPRRPGKSKSTPLAGIILVLVAILLCVGVAYMVKSLNAPQQESTPEQAYLPPPGEPTKVAPPIDYRAVSPTERDGPAARNIDIKPDLPEPDKTPPKADPAPKTDTPKKADPSAGDPATRPDPAKPSKDEPKTRPLAHPEHPLVMAADFLCQGNAATAGQLLDRQKAKGKDDPDYPVYLLVRGVLQLHQDEAESAAASWAGGCKAAPGNGEAHLYLAGSLLAARAKEAPAALARAQELMPSDSRVQYLVAMAYFNERDFTRCRQSLEQIGSGEGEVAKLAQARAQQVDAEAAKVAPLLQEREGLTAKMETLTAQWEKAKADVAAAEAKRDKLKAAYDAARDVPIQEHRTKLKEILAIYQKELPPESIRDSRRTEYERRIAAAQKARDAAALQAKQRLDAQLGEIDKKFKPQADAASGELKIAEAGLGDIARSRETTHLQIDRLTQKINRELKGNPFDVLADMKKHFPLTPQRVDAMLGGR